MTTDDLRIRSGIVRGPEIRFRCDDRELPAYEGETVSAALWAAGIRTWEAPNPGEPPARTLFCAMGACRQCLLWIDGALVEACRTPVRAGLDVRTRR